MVAPNWFRAALMLWALALGLGLLGLLLDAAALRALGGLVLRAAVVATVAWALREALGAVWRRIRRT